MSNASLPAEFTGLLEQQAKADQQQGIQHLFREDAGRAEQWSFAVEGMHIDFSKSHFSAAHLEAYESLAQGINFADKRLALLSGQRINVTEDRSVLHTLLRDPENQGIATQEPELRQQAATASRQFVQQHQSIIRQLAKRASAVRHIVHIGIGGSSLGTRLVFEALKEVSEDITLHFAGNIDGHELEAVLSQCQIDNTLVIGVSKTFTTAETLKNIRSIGDWYEANGGTDYLRQVFAVTANPAAAAEFGIPVENTVTFPEWVGGRYSVWSSVSLSAALILGMDKFAAFLEGAAAMDRHFYTAEPADNICFLASAIDHYYTNFMGATSKAIFAYDFRLRSLVDYLQQLETESNGKDRQRDGQPVDQKTSPVVWGGVGTDVQHSVFQMLHQGTSLIPAEFILVAKPNHTRADHHRELLANGLAQTAALLAGQSIDTVRELEGEGIGDLAAKAKVFAGEKPSTTLLLESLNPRILGALLAFYEHRTFCSGVLANINSFDQMGVELGKRLAKQLSPRLDSASEDTAESFDPSTEKLIATALKIGIE